MQTYKFVGMMWLLYRRFDNLYNYTLCEENNQRFICLEKEFNNITIQSAAWMHYNLMQAAKIINNIYSVQLFLWITFYSMNVSFQIFFVFERFKHNMTVTFGFSWVAFVINCYDLFIIAASCHITSRKRTNFEVSKAKGPTLIFPSFILTY
ncbi:hypothetical protein HCN44_008856 [Aphidius gifuensis]|uniref:Gustatory receptor n=1 Tax=Aphidius gifuensis TaxID=684658 RepID=A0A835CXQ6_APHGI|nr:hypothetical protein HCN44_008856 [Aphidius gifuensis]